MLEKYDFRIIIVRIVTGDFKCVFDIIIILSYDTNNNNSTVIFF